MTMMKRMIADMAEKRRTHGDDLKPEPADFLSLITR